MKQTGAVVQFPDGAVWLAHDKRAGEEANERFEKEVYAEMLRQGARKIVCRERRPDERVENAA